MTYEEIATELISTIPANLFAQYNKDGTNTIAVVKGPLEEAIKVTDTGLECVISKVANRDRRKNHYYFGDGRRKTLRFHMIVMLWQPWNPELSGQGLTSKISSLESDTGDGESVMDKIYNMDSSRWFIHQALDPRDDTNDHPESYSVSFEARSQYCD